MQNSILKEKLHQAVDSADSQLLEILFSIVSEFNESNCELKPQQQAELKRRLELFDSGKMKFATWDEMISRIEKVTSLPQ
ncbi:addiction module protein [Algoriphagus hitonicola]|uniref:Putative addiction module component, TIGR02574 family n=1 Tax=Algoriphagus hitonicola TaxID=435880 RepID=A0A1I2VIB1_9BACT|nr:addiction module protein [Algoriphagus hitonicola]SFG87226.1 putative addiction module component, TIGR02574 family [Algoriphagus hitonicola]